MSISSQLLQLVLHPELYKNREFLSEQLIENCNQLFQNKVNNKSFIKLISSNAVFLRILSLKSIQHCVFFLNYVIPMLRQPLASEISIIQQFVTQNQSQWKQRANIILFSYYYNKKQLTIDQELQLIEKNHQLYFNSIKQYKFQLIYQLQKLSKFIPSKQLIKDIIKKISVQNYEVINKIWWNLCIYYHKQQQQDQIITLLLELYHESEEGIKLKIKQIIVCGYDQYYSTFHGYYTRNQDNRTLCTLLWDNRKCQWGKYCYGYGMNPQSIPKFRKSNNYNFELLYQLQIQHIIPQQQKLLSCYLMMMQPKQLKKICFNLKEDEIIFKKWYNNHYKINHTNIQFIIYIYYLNNEKQFYMNENENYNKAEFYEKQCKIWVQYLQNTTYPSYHKIIQAYFWYTNYLSLKLHQKINHHQYIRCCITLNQLIQHNFYAQLQNYQRLTLIYQNISCSQLLQMIEQKNIIHNESLAMVIIIILEQLQQPINETKLHRIIINIIYDIKVTDENNQLSFIKLIALYLQWSLILFQLEKLEKCKQYIYSGIKKQSHDCYNEIQYWSEVAIIYINYQLNNKKQKNKNNNNNFQCLPFYQLMSNNNNTTKIKIPLIKCIKLLQLYQNKEIYFQKNKFLKSKFNCYNQLIKRVSEGILQQFQQLFIHQNQQFFSPQYAQKILTLTYIYNNPQCNFYYRNHFNHQIYFLLLKLHIIAFQQQLQNQSQRIIKTTLFEIYNKICMKLQQIIHTKMIPLIWSKQFYKQFYFFRFCYEIINKIFLSKLKLKQIYNLIDLILIIIQTEIHPLSRQYIEVIMCRIYCLVSKQYRNNIINILQVDSNGTVPILLTLGYQLLNNTQYEQKQNGDQRIQNLYQVFIKFIGCHTAYIRAIAQCYLLQYDTKRNNFLLKNYCNYWRTDKQCKRILKNMQTVINGFKIAVENQVQFLNFERIEDYPTLHVQKKFIKDQLQLLKLIKSKLNYKWLKIITNKQNLLNLQLKQLNKRQQQNPYKLLKSSKKVIKNLSKYMNQQIINNYSILSIDKYQQCNIIIIATLLEKVHNFGHIIRTLHHKKAMLTVPSKQPLLHPECQQLIPFDSDVEIVQVKQKQLEFFIKMQKQRGYALIVLQQCSRSISLEKMKFPNKFILLLGNQKTGTTSDLLKIADYLVQIPQNGKISSFNVHVSMVICLSEFIIS